MVITMVTHLQVTSIPAVMLHLVLERVAQKLLWMLIEVLHLRRHSIWSSIVLVILVIVMELLLLRLWHCLVL